MQKRKIKNSEHGWMKFNDNIKEIVEKKKKNKKKKA